MIEYVKGSVTEPIKGKGTNLVLHVCNDVGGWGPEGKSVAYDIGRKWPAAKGMYKSGFFNNDSLLLGDVQFVYVEAGLWVLNLIAQHGYRRPANLTPFKYDAFSVCCDKIAEQFTRHEAPWSVHMPKVGTGLGGADWHRVEQIVERRLVDRDFKVTVYVL